VRMESYSERFWQLLEPEYDEAMMFCRKLTASRDQGDDLFQDSLLAAYTNFRSLRDEAAFRPWLYRIIINGFRSQTRRPWWRRVTGLTQSVQDTQASPDPSNALAARRWLGRAFRVLSADDQAMVVLHELEGWTVADLAALWDRTEGAIKAKLFRARRKMKDEIVRFTRRDQSRDKQTDAEGAKPCAVGKLDVE